MNENFPTVTIGCPIRNREAYITEHLKCIYNLNYPKENITLLFLLNDSTDKTEEILKEFKSQHDKEYHRIKLEVYNLNAVEDKRTKAIREKYIYHTLSKLRNCWLSLIKTDYVLSCDSDIMITNPEILNKLLSHKKDYVSGLIMNHYLFDKTTPYNNILKKVGNQYQHITKYLDNSLIEVDFSGAIMLLSKKAYKTGKFGWHWQGEDACFSESLKNNGIKLYCDTSAKCTHCMSIEYLNKYKNNNFKFE